MQGYGLRVDVGWVSKVYKYDIKFYLLQREMKGSVEPSCCTTGSTKLSLLQFFLHLYSCNTSRSSQSHVAIRLTTPEKCRRDKFVPLLNC